MSASDSGSWKLLIFPFMIIFIIGIVFNLVVQPFVDNGVPINNEPSFIVSAMQNIIATGNIFNVSVISIPLLVTTLDIPVPNIFNIFPDSIQSFIINQVTIFSYLPTEIQVPLAIIITLSFIYALYVLFTMAIP